MSAYAGPLLHPEKGHVRRVREVGAVRLFVPLARVLLVTLCLNRKHSVVLLFGVDSQHISWTSPRSKSAGGRGIFISPCVWLPLIPCLSGSYCVS